MGRAVGHGIGRSYGGVITVYSKLGKGSVFQVVLPRLESKGEESELETPAPTLRGDECILFVDDENVLADMRGDMLTLGYDVIVRTSRVEALELFRQRRKGCRA